MRRTVLIAALALLLAAPAAHAFPGRNGLLAYGWSALDEPELGLPSTDTDGIRTIEPSGGSAQVLRQCLRTQGQPDTGDCTPTAYRDPSWSPDGTRIVFDAGAQLALLDGDGGAMRLLPAHGEDDGEPVFSPGGTKLAFSTGPAGGAARELWTSGVYGAGARRLVGGAGASPTWSPKGVIAFERRGQLWTVRPDGSGLRQLTRKGGVQPAYSPHGTKLAFLRRRTVTVMNADGSGLKTLRVLTDAATVRWSPDGRRLVVEQFDTGISIANTDGTGARIVVQDAFGATYNQATSGVDWQPLR